MNRGYGKVIRDFKKRMGRRIEKIDMSTRVGTRLRDELLVFLKGYSRHNVYGDCALIAISITPALLTGSVIQKGKGSNAHTGIELS